MKTVVCVKQVPDTAAERRLKPDGILDSETPDGKITAEQSAFGGAANVRSTKKTGTPIITVRPSSTAPQPAP